MQALLRPPDTSQYKQYLYRTPSTLQERFANAFIYSLICVHGGITKGKHYYQQEAVRHWRQIKSKDEATIELTIQHYNVQTIAIDNTKAQLSSFFFPTPSAPSEPPASSSSSNNKPSSSRSKPVYTD